MGDQAEDIFLSFDLSQTEQLEFDIVLKHFNDYFIVKNKIFERSHFNKRKQPNCESVNAFMAAFYTMAKHYEYGLLHDEIIYDRNFVGMHDKNLNEKLPLHAYHVSSKASEKARLS